jgi:hypothetical protein
MISIMKVSYQYITKIFQHSISQSTTPFEAQNEISELLFACIEVNKKLWKLEDVSRMHELGFEAIAKTKMEIDLTNQRRNEIINQLDVQIEKLLGNVQSESLEKFYSESPAILIDRIAIMFIRHHFIEELIAVIEDNELLNEYLDKEKLLTQNMNDFGGFLDSYFVKIENGEAYFKVYKPLKIYNDDRVKNYIQLLLHKNKTE